MGGCELIARGRHGGVERRARSSLPRPSVTWSNRRVTDTGALSAHTFPAMCASDLNRLFPPDPDGDDYGEQWLQAWLAMPEQRRPSPAAEVWWPESPAVNASTVMLD